MMLKLITKAPSIARSFSSTISETQPEKILIIGGGIMGSATAYWLKLRAGNKANVTVLEKSPMFAHSSTALSAGGLRQQFSQEEYIQMSLFGAEFLRNVNKYLAVEGSRPPEVRLKENGYLILASEKEAATLENNSRIQNSLGACNELLTAQQLKNRFPWLETNDIVLGCLGLKNEGWFDPWLLLEALRKKAHNLGANFITGEVVDFSTLDTGDKGTGAFLRVESAIVKTEAFENVQVAFDKVLIAAGAQSGHVSKLAGIGRGEGDLAVPLPVERRKRVIYYFRCPDGPDNSMPLTVNPQGVYFRAEGENGSYLCGCYANENEDTDIESLQHDHSYFKKKIWPRLAATVPAFEKLKIQSSWAGYYEHNTIDQCAVIGRHPCFHNLYLASGFSGHGTQHGPAVGRALMELLLDDCYHTIDLGKFSFDRLLKSNSLNGVKSRQTKA